METSDERQKQLDEIYSKIALRENLTPYEYDMILEEKKTEIEELQEQCANTKELMEIIDKQDQTIRNYQERFEALSEEFNKVCEHRDTLIRVIDKLI